MTIYAVIDFETTGLEPTKDYPIQLGWVLVEDNGKNVFMLNKPKSVRIKTPLSRSVYHNAAWRVHGIPYETTAAGYSPEEAFKFFSGDVYKAKPQDRLGVPTVAGHNVSFDFAFLKRLNQLAGDYVFPYDYHLMDTATLGMLFYGVRALDSIVKLAGVDYDWRMRHDAKVDVEITAKVLMHFLNLRRRLLY